MTKLVYTERKLTFHGDLAKRRFTFKKSTPKKAPRKKAKPHKSLAEYFENRERFGFAS